MTARDLNLHVKVNSSWKRKKFRGRRERRECTKKFSKKERKGAGRGFCKKAIVEA